ncbi:MAG: hypothetical protein ABIE84_03465 [bacterium]
MNRTIHPRAGQKLASHELITRKQMRDLYGKKRAKTDKVKNGTSGHRGKAGAGFNRSQVASMTQALVDIRNERGTYGPDVLSHLKGKPAGSVVVGHDVRALSDFARVTTIGVLAANGVTSIVDIDGRAVPTPVVSRRIINGNKQAESGTEGIIVTASHNAPDNGGIKSNGQDGGPNTRTAQIDERSNQLLPNASEIAQVSMEEAVAAGLVVTEDLQGQYVAELPLVVNIEAVREGRFAATSLGGSAHGYYERINAEHGTNIVELLAQPDPAGANRTIDHDGVHRGDPSSPYVMKAVDGMRKEHNVPFVGANDNDADRFGGEDSTGILNPNHILSVVFHHLATTRGFDQSMGIGRTIGTSHMLDAIANSLGRPVHEVNVGFKYYVKGLVEGRYVLAGEESAGFSVPQMDGSTWVTEKDGIVAVLLMMEIIASTGKDIGTLYGELVAKHGTFNYDRVDSPATDAKKKRLKALASDPAEVHRLLDGKKVNGRDIERMVIGDGIKVVLKGGIWVLKRPSGTEPIIKDYQEAHDQPLGVAAKASEELDALLGLPS